MAEIAQPNAARPFARPTPGPMEWGGLVFLGMIWGASFMAVEIALESWPPLWIVAGRVSLAALFLLFISGRSGIGLPSLSDRIGRRVWLHAVAMGFFSNALPFSLLSWAQKHVTSGFAGITMAAVPLLILPLAHFLVPGEQLTLRKVLGFAIGFIGVGVLIGPGIFDSAGSPLEGIAQIACLGAAASYAVGSIITRLTPPTPLLAFSTAALLSASVMMLPLAWLTAPLPELGNLAADAAVLYLALLPTAAATLILVRIIHRAGPAFLSLVNYQVPVWATIFGIVFLGEALPGRFIVALGLILLGLILGQGRASRTRRKSEQRAA